MVSLLPSELLLCLTSFLDPRDITSWTSTCLAASVVTLEMLSKCTGVTAASDWVTRASPRGHGVPLRLSLLHERSRVAVLDNISVRWKAALILASTRRAEEDERLAAETTQVWMAACRPADLLSDTLMEGRAFSAGGGSSSPSTRSGLSTSLQWHVLSVIARSLPAPSAFDALGYVLARHPPATTDGAELRVDHLLTRGLHAIALSAEVAELSRTTTVQDEDGIAVRAASKAALAAATDRLLGMPLFSGTLRSAIRSAGVLGSLPAVPWAMRRVVNRMILALPHPVTIALARVCLLHGAHLARPARHEACDACVAVAREARVAAALPHSPAILHLVPHMPLAIVHFFFLEAVRHGAPDPALRCLAFHAFRGQQDHRHDALRASLSLALADIAATGYDSAQLRRVLRVCPLDVRTRSCPVSDAVGLLRARICISRGPWSRTLSTTIAMMVPNCYPRGSLGLLTLRDNLWAMWLEARRREEVDVMSVIASVVVVTHHHPTTTMCLG